MRKLTYLIGFCLWIVLPLNAQDSTQCRFQFSFGGGYLQLSDAQVQYTFQPYNKPAYEILTPHNYHSFYPVLLHLRFNVIKFRHHDMALNVSAPVNLNFYGEVSFPNNSVGAKKSFLLANMPLLLEYSIGHAAFCHCAPDKSVGAFVAAGVGKVAGSGRIGSFSNIQPYAQAGLHLNLLERFALEITYGMGYQDQINLNKIYYADVRPVAGTDYTAKKSTKAFNISLIFH